MEFMLYSNAPRFHVCLPVTTLKNYISSIGGTKNTFKAFFSFHLVAMMTKGRLNTICKGFIGIQFSSTRQMVYPFSKSMV